MTNYSSKRVGIELKAQLEKGYNIVRLSRWAYRLIFNHMGELDSNLEEILQCLAIMEDDPQFEYTEQELRIVAELLINEEENPPLKQIDTILAKQYLPLKIAEVRWDGTIFQMYNLTWKLTTLGVWRISAKNKIIFGCLDKGSIQLVNSLKDLEILDIDFQTHSLKVDPVFILSNGQRLEIFSTVKHGAWNFSVSKPGMFSADQIHEMASLSYQSYQSQRRKECL
jgi:hypothetical protein